MSKHIKDRADFEKIRYANCWEDADVLCESLQPCEGKRFLSIASAGDNSFSLLAGGASVVAADLSLAQLACVELRREAFRGLSHASLLSFLGVTAADDRLQVYQTLRPGLSDWAQDFWDLRSSLIEMGIIQAGKFEGYFRLFRTRVVPLIHSRNKVAKLLQHKSLDEQHKFYMEDWNSLRWRLMFRMFFSRWAMGRLGRDPEFFRYVEGSVADRILSRTKHALTEIPTATNPYLHFILNGNFSPGQASDGDSSSSIALPHYLRRENFDSIRAGLDRLTLFHGSIQDAAVVHAKSGFDGYNLSDIFEYLDPELCERIYRQLLELARPGARWVYWNMLVPRRAPAELAGEMTCCDELMRELFEQDKAWFYSALVVEEKS